MNSGLKQKMHYIQRTFALIALASTTAFSQIPEVPDAFPNDQTFEPGQLLWRQVGLGRITNIGYHNGIMYTNNVGAGDKSSWEWSDPSDITSLAEVDHDFIPSIADQGNHSHTKVGDYIGGGATMEIRRVSPGVNAFDQEHPDWDLTFNGITLYWPWSLSFNWLQYSSTVNGRSEIGRLNEPLIQWNTLADHGVTGAYILMGNILIVASDESKLGVLTYDISPIFETPPREPVLLDKLSGAIGAYLPVLWENYIVFARRDTNTVDIVDWSDPTNLRFVTSIDVSGTPGLNSITNVPYVQAQDEFIFARRHKINMETFETVLELDEVGNSRPANSVPGRLGTSQYMLPIGQFLVTGGYSHEGQDGMGIWAHQAGPDNRAPYVGYHIPQDGQTNYPTRAPVSILIHETLESFTMVNGESVIVRPVGGSPVDAWISFSHDDVMTITPKQPLTTDTTYEVIIVDGGIKDAVGNGIEPYSFSFSTGGSVEGSNRAPEILTMTANPTPASPGEEVTITVTAEDPEDDTMEYRFTTNDDDFTNTSWQSQGSTTHTFNAPGRYDFKVQVRDQKPNGSNSIVTSVVTLTIQEALTGPAPTKSTPIYLDQDSRTVWTVNPDNDSVTEFDADNQTIVRELDLSSLLNIDSVDPRSVAVDNNGQVWVTCYDADRIVVLDGSSGTLLHQINTEYGSTPHSLALTPDGTQALISLEARGSIDAGNGQILRINTTTFAEIDRLELGPAPRAIAITSDGTRALVTRFISPKDYGVVWDLDLSGPLSLTRTLILHRDRGDHGLDSSSNGAGVPNYLGGVTISPDGDWAWVSAKKDQTERGLFFDQGTNNSGPLDHEHTVRAMLIRIDLNLNREPFPILAGDIVTSRIDIDNSEFPTTIEFSPLGDYVFTALQGNNEVAVFDRFGIDQEFTRATTWRLPAGSAPQGLLIDPITQNLWVKNFLSRDITIHPLGNFFQLGNRALDADSISAVSTEKLRSDILSGKQTFYHASDQMSSENYISCASCHIDGGHDGRVFDFTQRGEGFRNTTDLRGRGGMSHGRVHWTGNFNEIQDFILDIVNEFGGEGFLPEGETPHPPLDSRPNAGRSEVLDNLAAYVSSLKNDTIPRSPYRNSDGSLTSTAISGRSIFAAENCASCHSSTTFTDSTSGSAVLHNVGTHRSSSGNRLNSPLTGIDTPTLHGLWTGAPFFHDGQASDLESVFNVTGGEIYQLEDGQLGGSAFIPNFIRQNYDGSPHGLFVDLHETGPNASVTLNQVDGGTGGTGALEFRYLSFRDGSFRVIVNGTPYDVNVSAEVARREWRQARIEGIALTAGTTNTLVIERAGFHIVLDDVLVSRPEDLAAANAHRRVGQLASTQQQQLLSYLRQLDGRDDSGSPLPSAPTAQARFSGNQISYGDAYGTIFELRADRSQADSALTYLWNIPGATFLDGTSQTDEIVRVSFAGDTTISVTLTITDQQGMSSSITQEIPVLDEHHDNETIEVPGVLYDYFEFDSTFFVPNFFEQTPVRSGIIPSFDIVTPNRGDQFQQRLSANIWVETEGTYTFYTTSDDGSLLFVNGLAIVDNNGPHPAITRSGTIELTRGYHQVVIGYSEVSGGETLTAEWEGPGIPRQIIPPSVLTHTQQAPKRSYARAAFDVWYENHFGHRDFSVDPSDDPEGNSHPLITEYALGTEPGSGTIAFGSLSGSEDLDFIIDKLRIAEGLTSVFEYSTDLQTWHNADSRYTLSRNPVEPGFEQRTYRKNTPLSLADPVEFLRLRVTMDNSVSE